MNLPLLNKKTQRIPKIKSSKTQKKEETEIQKDFFEIPIPSFTILFARHGEFVSEEQVIGQITSIEEESIENEDDQRDQTKFNMSSELEGRIFFRSTGLGARTSKGTDTFIYNPKPQSFWVLAGKIFNASSPFFSKVGDLVDRKSLLTKIFLKSREEGFVHFKNHKKKYDYNYEEKKHGEYQQGYEEDKQQRNTKSINKNFLLKITKIRSSKRKTNGKNTRLHSRKTTRKGYNPQKDTRNGYNTRKITRLHSRKTTRKGYNPRKTTRINPRQRKVYNPRKTTRLHSRKDTRINPRKTTRLHSRKTTRKGYNPRKKTRLQ